MGKYVGGNSWEVRMGNRVKKWEKVSIRRNRCQ